jgi:hypothetical protein
MEVRMTSPGGGETWPQATGSPNSQDYETTTPSYPIETTYPEMTYPETALPLPLDGTQPIGGSARDARGSEGSVGEVIEKTQEVAGAGMEEAGRVASEAVDQARNLVDQLRTQVDEQSREQLSRLSTAVREFADELDHMVLTGGGDGPATTVVREASRRARILAARLGEHSGGSLLGEIEGQARRRPGLFLLGAAVAGIVAGRLAKDVPQGTHLREQDAPYPRPYLTTMPTEIDLTESGMPASTPGTLPTGPGVFDDRPGAMP